MDTRPACNVRVFKSPRQQTRHSKKKGRRPILPQLRLQVWETYIGKSINGLCFVCNRTPITFGINVEYGHVVAVACGGANTIENLRPICGSCNRSMGTENLLEYKARLARSLGNADAFASASTSSSVDAPASTSAMSSSLTKLSQSEYYTLNSLQILQDSQIKILARILGISYKKNGSFLSASRAQDIRNARVLIATRRYVLPRRLNFGGCMDISRDDVREIIAELDNELLVAIFGAQSANASTNALRHHAFAMLGMSAQ